jgi:hypothetical protein
MGRRHFGGESPYLRGQFSSALCNQGVANYLPPSLNTFPSLKKSRLARLDAQVAADQFSSNSFGPVPGAMGISPLLGAIDAVLLRWLALAAYRPLCRVSRDAQHLQVLSEFSMAVLLGEQNVTFALPHADRVYVLDHARIAWEGPPDRFESEGAQHYL